MGFNFRHMDSFTIDVLKEISNIGAGNAATSLSKLLKRRIDMGVPVIKVLEFSEVATILGDKEKIVASVFVQVMGSITGMLLLVLESDDAISLVEILTKRRYRSLEVMDEVARSAIRETGSILCGTYMAALAGLTGLNVRCRYPEVFIDMAGAALSMPAISMASIAENVLYIDSGFVEGQDSIKANIFLVPEGQSFDTLLKALGVG